MALPEFKYDEKEKQKEPLEQGVDLEEAFLKANQLPEEIVREKVAALNKRVRLGNNTHEVKVCVDPTANTWACAKVPLKRNINGQTIETSKSQYFIIMPYAFLGVEDEDVILGELRHELGHAIFTPWKMNARLEKFVEDRGYEKKSIGSLLNCLEDPRMEHVSAFPKHIEGYVQNLFWAKNKGLILPNIGEGIAKNQPVMQFNFLIKLYSLWRIHKIHAENDNVSPWDNIEGLHPDVQEAWDKVRPTIEKIVGVGEYEKPITSSLEFEQLFKNDIWEPFKKLLDKHGSPPEEDQQQQQQQGRPGKDGDPEGDRDPSGDPGNIDNLSPELQQIINQQIENKNKAIEQQRKQQVENAENAEKRKKERGKEKQKRLEKTDGIKSPEARKTYNKISREARLVKNVMKRIFEKYFPKVAYPKEKYDIKGKKYVIKQHLKAYGTGMEKPMATPNIPDKSGLVLQIIVDKSGSMRGPRIQEVIKTVVGILDAAQDYPIHIEILAADDNLHEIKTFDEEFSGSKGGIVKSRLVELYNRCEGGNEDAKTLKQAVPRIVAKKRKLKADYDKMGALVIFLSDAEFEGQQDPVVVNELRKKVAIIGGCVENDPNIKNQVEKAYGQIGRGSFCPDSLRTLPKEFKKVIGKTIRQMMRK